MGSKMKIYRDANNLVINIGDWDYQIDGNGNAQNPLPINAIEDDAEIVTGWDGGLYLANDPRALK
jgi:hypothetical protein